MATGRLSAFTGGRRGWILPLLAALAFVGLWTLAQPAVNPVNDSYRYARATLSLLGTSPAEAQREALAAACEEQARWNARTASLDPVAMEAPPRIAERTRQCIARYPNGLTPNAPRYEAIFEDRIGYSVLAAPFVGLFGVNLGLSVTSVLFTALGGALIFWLLREVGVSVGIAVGGQLFYYFSPLGWWGSYPLTEGPVLAFTAAALLGSWWLLRQRIAAGAALLIAALVLGTAIRYSTFLLVAAALAAAALLTLATTRTARRPGTWLLVGIGATATVGIFAMAKVLGLSGTGETLQDTFTNHFVLPDVADPWRRLVDLNLNFWPSWFRQELRAPWLLLGLGFGAWALFRRDTALAWVTLALAGTGLATQIAHPMWVESDRLYVAVWLVPVVGLPLLLDRLMADRRATSADAPVSGTPADGWSTTGNRNDGGLPDRPLREDGEPASGLRDDMAFRAGLRATSVDPAAPAGRHPA
ncbi:hypothetical protein ACQP2C_10395 [Micromonospora zamorensis]|uniref:hypothetical protein n=1 Tax=Micromonospora zamorensis TaxID=709883 RepID=UPI003D954E02